MTRRKPRPSMLQLELVDENPARGSVSNGVSISATSRPVLAGSERGRRAGTPAVRGSTYSGSHAEREAKAWIKRDGSVSWQQELVRRRGERNARTRARTAALVASRRVAS